MSEVVNQQDKKQRSVFWLLTFTLMLVAFSLQSCVNSGPDSPFQDQATGQGNDHIGINRGQPASFTGHIYFTLKRNLYVLDSKGGLKQLTYNMDVRDPAVSPNGQMIAFIQRYKDHSDLMLMDTQGQHIQVLLSGAGQYQKNPATGALYSTAKWIAQPAWNADNKHLLFVSDMAKLDLVPCHYDAALLDPLIFEMSIDESDQKPQLLTYTTAGAGGQRDPDFRPGHNDQMIFTGYAYGTSDSVARLYMQDPQAVPDHPYRGYRAGLSDCESDPSVPITGPDQDNMQPDFSPDGNNILYVRREDATHMSLYTMPVPEGITGDPHDPQFDPNTKENLDKGLSLYDQSQKLLTGAYISQPLWSPDGQHILYYGFANNYFDLWLAKVQLQTNGSYILIAQSQVQLTNTQGQLDSDSRACWTS